MNQQTRTVIAIVLSTLMLVSAGCAGLMDGDTDSGEPESDGNGEAQDDVDADTDDSQDIDTDGNEVDDSDDVDAEQSDSETGATDSDTDEASSTDTETDDSSSVSTEHTDDSNDSETKEKGDNKTGDVTDTEESKDTDGASEDKDTPSDPESPDEDEDNGVTDPEAGNGEDEANGNGTGEDNGDNGVSDSDDETDDGNDETSVHTVTVETTMDSPDLMVTGDDQFPGEVNDGTTFDIEEGSYDVIVEVSGDRSLHFVEESEQTLTVDGDTTWTIEVGYDGAPVTITVVDENGDPIEGAFAGIEEAGAGTGSDGIAEFDVDVRYDMYNVEVSADGYETNIVEIAPGESTTVTLMEESENFSIPVTVTDAETGEPIEGADVTAHPVDASGLPVDSVSGETDESGTVTLEVDTLGGVSYDIVAEADGYEPSTFEYRVADDEANIELESTELEVVETTVHVEDGNTNELISGVGVEFVDLRGGPDVTADGQLVDDRTADGEEYAIELTHPDYETKNATITGGDTWTFHMTPTEPVDEENDDGLLATAGQLLPVAV